MSQLKKIKKYIYEDLNPNSYNEVIIRLKCRVEMVTNIGYEYYGKSGEDEEETTNTQCNIELHR